MQPEPKDVPTSQPSSFGEHRQGDPDAPEERNPRGHDSFNPPDIATEAEGPSPDPVPADRKTSAAPGSAAVTDAKFLADEFVPKNIVPLPSSQRGVSDQKTPNRSRRNFAKPDAMVIPRRSSPVLLSPNMILSRTATSRVSS